jgi:hypothetical protein
MFQPDSFAHPPVNPWRTTLAELAASMAGGLVLLAFAIGVG